MEFVVSFWLNLANAIYFLFQLRINAPIGLWFCGNPKRIQKRTHKMKYGQIFLRRDSTSFDPSKKQNLNPNHNRRTQKLVGSGDERWKWWWYWEFYYKWRVVSFGWVPTISACACLSLLDGYHWRQNNIQDLPIIRAFDIIDKISKRKLINIVLYYLCVNLALVDLAGLYISVNLPKARTISIKIRSVFANESSARQLRFHWGGEFAVVEAIKSLKVTICQSH